jgi:hypothetical protein
MTYRTDGRPRVNKRKLKRIMERKATLQGDISGGTLPPYVQQLHLPSDDVTPRPEPAPLAKARGSEPSEIRKQRELRLRHDAQRRARLAAAGKAAGTAPVPTLRQGKRAGPTERKPDGAGNAMSTPLGEPIVPAWARRNDFGDWRDR